MSFCLWFLLTRPGGKGEGQRVDTLGLWGATWGKELEEEGEDRLQMARVVSVGLQESFGK